MSSQLCTHYLLVIIYRQTFYVARQSGYKAKQHLRWTQSKATFKGNKWTRNWSASLSCHSKGPDKGEMVQWSANKKRSTFGNLSLVSEHGTNNNSSDPPPRYLWESLHIITSLEIQWAEIEHSNCSCVTRNSHRETELFTSSFGSGWAPPPRIAAELTRAVQCNERSPPPYAMTVLDTF